MKTNEVPEKIYLQVCGDCNIDDCNDCRFEDLEGNITWCKDKIFEKDIEYTCTDAFIEKAVEWLKNNVEKYYYLDEAYEQVISIKNLNNDFKNYMRGE